MKTNELIRKLTEADPSGELEVTVGKTDIFFLQVLPGYYDGCYQTLKRDPELEEKCYDVIGAEIRSESRHVCINTLGVCDALLDNPDLPVSFDGEYAERHYASIVEKWRSEMRKINDDVEAKMTERPA